MEKKARVKRLNHQDDVKRSWAAAYSITEEFGDISSDKTEDTLTSENDAQPSNSLEPQNQPIKPPSTDS
jgi:hypothetical protein